MENGKKVCKELKAVRKQIADANGIEYVPNECSHKGDCPGTCPACEAEVRYLERELSLRSKLGKATVVAGLSIAVAACASSCLTTKGDVRYNNNDNNGGPSVRTSLASGSGTEKMLQGDVAKVIEVKCDTTEDNQTLLGDVIEPDTISLKK